jgi:hypothetical protein
MEVLLHSFLFCSQYMYCLFFIHWWIQWDSLFTADQPTRILFLITHESLTC